MDDHTDDRDPDRPPVGTPEELEEALKWLEDLTARQGKPADASKPTPAPALESPFRGLIESEDGDLPDWLRELPPSRLDENEPESRLDWLAKMAQQESIEELPTLEWRRLSEPAQSAILTGQSIDLPTEAYPRMPGGEETADAQEEITAESIEEIINESAETPPVTYYDDIPAEQPEAVEPGEGEAAMETPDVEYESAPVESPVEEETPEPVTIEDEAEAEIPDDELIVPPIAPITMGLDEILVEDRLAEDVAELFPAGPYDDEGPLDDLDAAMAWIEELAASQNAPIEDVPSVADRALASKLMMEAGLTPTVSPLDELGSDSDLIEGATPTHPFIEEEDFADTVVLVETLAADQGITLEPPVEPESFQESDFATDVTGFQEGPEFDTTPAELEPSEFEETPEELSFEEAMALLDEMAIEQSPLEDEAGELEISEIETPLGIEIASEEIPAERLVVEPDEGSPPQVLVGDEELTVVELADLETGEFESLSPEDVPWLDTPAEALIVAPLAFEESADTGRVVEELNGTGLGELEAALLSLDALALPPGKTLDEVAAKLTVAQMTSWRDVDSALNWLEQRLSQEVAPAVPAPTGELDDASLIEQMPEDPDAVLAWLEQMAAEEEGQGGISAAAPEELSDVIADRTQAEPLLEELAEADLLNMPDDPDEAMAWLEGLARGGQPEPKPAELAVAGEALAPDEQSVDMPESVAVAAEVTEDETIGQPEVEIFIDSDNEVITIDTELEDSTGQDMAEAVQAWPEALEVEMAPSEELSEHLSVESEATAEPSSDVVVVEDALVEELAFEEEGQPSIVDQQDFEDRLADVMLSADSDAPSTADELAADIPETITADDITAHAEEQGADEEQIGESLPETKPPLPSWLDLLKPLD